MIFNSLAYSNGESLPVKTELVDYQLKQFKLKDIKKYGEDTYSKFLTLFCANTFDFAGELYRNNILYRDITNYNFFINLLFSFYPENKRFQDLLHDFLGVRGIQVLPIEETHILLNTQNEIIITQEEYNIIRRYLKTMTSYQNKKIERFGNEYSEEIYLEYLVEEIEDDERETSEDSTVSLFSMIGAIVLETSYTYETVMEMYMYQFHMCTSAILKRQEWKNTMLGIYTGNIDAKKINLQELNWLNNN